MADLNDGLVAYYPFDGNAQDESGNGNNGTVHGAILTEDRFGNVESAYRFDGTNSFIEVMDTPALRLNNTDFTVSAWVYETERNVSYQDAILTKRSSGSRNGWFYSIGTKN
ncbi:LamG domain protein jellyroll fold domain protein [Candidatus Thiomargarita nelsonii]|uniref:LamG domain protein jellyroll fold domain protein n=1 Tax=Candidatus Thiomargarita nelsonii TaxID=1003181 RepID=A0A176RSS3_9GAMM|nr:LamG domain protein jellyroll fold domain protein [Candidatus Thiomargarita nelsonii]